MATSKWKRVQREVARQLSMERESMGPGRSPTLVSPDLVLVAVHRAEAPQWIQARISQALNRRTFDSQQAGVLLTTDDGDAYLILRADTLVQE